MKQYILLLLMLLTINFSVVNAKKSHSKHQRIETTVAAKDSTAQGVEAFSDTAQEDSGVTYSQTPPCQKTIIDDAESKAADNIVDLCLNKIGQSFGGVLLAIVVVFCVFLFLLLPFIIIIMVLRYLIKKHNDRVNLMQQAIEKGQPLPNDIKKTLNPNNEYLWSTGVKHVAIGVGIMLMFGIWNMKTLVGIGGLVVCLGIGQLVIVKTTNKKDDETE